MGARLIRMFVACVVAAVGSAAIVWWMNRPAENDGSLIGGFSSASVGGPFELTDHTGSDVTDADFLGRPMLMYFGFTYCPDVCPTELSRVASVATELSLDGGNGRSAITPVFVTIDPERDDPPAIAQYVGLFHPDMVGLTGTPEQIAAIARTYRVYYQRVSLPDSADDYTMDHSSYLYAIDARGEVADVFTPDDDIDHMVDVMQRLVEVGT